MLNLEYFLICFLTVSSYLTRDFYVLTSDLFIELIAFDNL